MSRIKSICDSIPHLLMRPSIPLFSLTLVGLLLFGACEVLYPDPDDVRFQVGDLIWKSELTTLNTVAGLKGRHIWAMSQLLEWVAICITGVLAIYFAARADVSWLPTRLTVNCLLGSLAFSVLFVAAVWSRYGMRRPFDRAAYIHGELFTHAFEIAKTKGMENAVSISDILAVLLAGSVAIAVTRILATGVVPASIQQASNAEWSLFRSKNDVARRQLQCLLGMTSATLAVAIVQINALARFPISLLASDHQIEIVQAHADAATFAAAVAITLLLVSLFAPALIIVERYRQRLSGFEPSQTMACENQASSLAFALQLGKFILPMLVGLLASFLGVGL